MTRAQAPVIRGLAEIAELVALATCGQCWARQAEPCAVPPGSSPSAAHLARFDRACRRGLISGPDMAAVIALAGPLASPAAVVEAVAR